MSLQHLIGLRTRVYLHTQTGISGIYLTHLTDARFGEAAALDGMSQCTALSKQGENKVQSGHWCCELLSNDRNA